MARHIDAWMDGRKLSSIGPVVIQDVDEPGPEVEITYATRPGHGGQIVKERRRKKLSVTINAQINELFDLKRRAEIRAAIAEWCDGEVLELSNHPGQWLHVICKNAPGIGKARDFNSVIAVELEANEIPYWEDKFPVGATGTAGTTGSASLLIPGSCREIPVNAVFTPASGSTVTSLTVTVSSGGVSRSISLSGISASGDVVFSRNQFDILTIYTGTTNLLPYRTEASADDLYVPAGTVTCTWTANCGVTPVFSARGRWL